MKIEAVDFFYLSMPEVLDIGDGSQDALLVRIRAGGLEGWGECEASPLTSIASYVCPMSHSACKSLQYSLEGKNLDGIEDIYRISAAVHENSLDLLQADHTLSGIDIALWDLAGKILDKPLYQLLGGPMRAAAPVYSHGNIANMLDAGECRAWAQRGMSSVPARPVCAAATASATSATSATSRST